MRGQIPINLDLDYADPVTLRKPRWLPANLETIKAIKEELYRGDEINDVRRLRCSRTPPGGIVSRSSLVASPGMPSEPRRRSAPIELKVAIRVCRCAFSLR